MQSREFGQRAIYSKRIQFSYRIFIQIFFALGNLDFLSKIYEIENNFLRYLNFWPTFFDFAYVHIKFSPLSLQEDENRVEVLNGTALISVLNEQSNSNVTNRTTPAICSLVLFYAPWCPFSARAAPHYNALARLYPDLVLMAVDANRHHAFTTQFGVLALPTILLFHNAKTFIKFNQTDFELDNFTTFLTTFTGIEPISGDLIIMESDMEGPMSSKFVPETDIYLHMSWAFVIICALGYFGKSSFCQNIIETMRNNWREAEIQHEHND